jgi:hypothetical protein
VDCSQHYAGRRGQVLSFAGRRGQDDGARDDGARSCLLRSRFAPFSK